MSRLMVTPESVPDRAFAVEHQGMLCVDWEWDGGREASVESPLPAFAKLAEVSETDVGPTIVSLVEQFGTLSLCEPHRRPWLVDEHVTCPRLKPEPFEVWLLYARRVQRVLHILEALNRGTDPAPSDQRNPPRAGDNAGDAFTSRWNVKLERRFRRTGFRFGDIETFPGEIRDEVDSMACTLQSKEEESSALRKTIQNLLPSADDKAEWRGWVNAEVNRGLSAFPTTVQLSVDKDTGAMRPILSTSVGLLSRVYLSLALELARTPNVEFCMECGQPYTPQRRPKRGQANFCPGCREARVPQRRHMRRKRAR